MHGEYKTPGGKMVVVDFAVAEGSLFDIQVSGDFFLYPDDALAHIADSLEGLPTSSSADTIADHVQRSLAPDTVLLGFSPLAVGQAVRNALGYDARTSGEMRSVEMRGVEDGDAARRDYGSPELRPARV